MPSCKHSLVVLSTLAMPLFGGAAKLAANTSFTVSISGQNTTVTMAELVSFLKEAPNLGSDYAPVRLGTDLNIFWLLFGACLVFLMQAGFAMLEVGSVSVKNTKNILVKNLFDASLGAISFWSLGFAFALGSGNGFIGTSGFFLKDSSFMVGADGAEAYNGYQYATWVFQFAFAATAATIVSGSVAERVSFHSYMAYTFFLTLFIYPVVVHWGWSADGWASAWKDLQADKLFGCGVLDFAGSGVVHMTGGVAALVGAIMVGPRTGRFTKDGRVVEFPQQSPVFQTLGTLILWFGWYGFNCASTLALSGGLASVAAKTAVTTTISAATAGVVSIPASKFMTGAIDPGALNNCILAGLVAITAGCSVVEPEGAFIIGAIAAPIYFGASKLLKKFRIDDVVDAVPVHLFNGAWGVIAAGLFATPENYKAAYYDYGANTPCGLFYGCGGAQFGANFVFVLAVLAWVSACAGILFFACDKTMGGLRVSREVEMVGMDSSEHGGSSYPELSRTPLADVSNSSAFSEKEAEEAVEPAAGTSDGENSA